MHKSRLGCIVIDCQTEQIDVAAAFWAGALGWPAAPLSTPGTSNYLQLQAPDGEVAVLLQQVTHPSRVLPQRASFEDGATVWDSEEA